MFSGIGGFELGIQNSGEFLSSQSPQSFQDMPDSKERQNRFTCVGFSEIDKYATQIYKKHFPNHKEYGNARDIISEEIKDFDLLVGGFPCQAFSIAGKKKGFDDTRGTLFFEIARILRDKRPRCVLLENVKGLLSHDSGKTFQTILKVLSNLGYRVEWQVLNSKNFGVPQNRERVFIIGHLGNGSGSKVFPIGGENKKSCVEVGTITGINGHDILKRCYSTEGLAPVLNTCQGGNLESKFLMGVSQTRGGKEKPRIYKKTAPSITAGDYKEPRLICHPILTPERPEKRQSGRRFKEDGDPAFTLTAQDKHGIYDGCKIRRLTPTECERLQAFPDGWTEQGTEGKISDSQRYKCLGNSVTVNVIQAIIEKMFTN